jgi:hypothetical protein
MVDVGQPANHVMHLAMATIPMLQQHQKHQIYTKCKLLFIKK